VNTTNFVNTSSLAIMKLWKWSWCWWW